MMNVPALTLTDLKSMAVDGKIDTILVAIPDHMGRLVGKRVTAPFFFNHMVDGGMHMCDYLLTVDVEMNPLDGFDMTSWDKGYGDFHTVLDTRTLRLIPWLPGTALILGDLEWEDGSPVAPSPRAILRRQLNRLKEMGMTAKTGSELEFYLFLEKHEDLAQRNFQKPKLASEYIIDYHILQSTRDEHIIRQIRNQMTLARVPVEFSKGEWGRGQQEINLEYAEAMEMADRHVIYKNGVKEIAWANGCSATFMAKYDGVEAGSSCHLHSSLWSADGREAKFWDSEGKKESQLFRHYLAGQMKYSAELFLFYASTVNAYKRYQAATFAPTSIAWAHDNRTCGLRVMGHGKGFRVENRMPGADANPYLAFAATIAAGIAGIEEKLDPGAPYKGDAYKDPNLPKVPKSLTEAAASMEGSALARAAFGGDVVDHYVRLARLEQKAFDLAITDWERRRYFDRI